MLWASVALSLQQPFTATGDTTAPGAPTNLTATGTYKAINVTWTNPTDTDLKEIEIYRSDTSGGTYSKIAVVTGEQYFDQVLTFGTTKFYKAKAKDFSGNLSGFSNADSGTTTFVDDGEFTTEVENLFANANVKQVDVVSSLPASGDYVGQVVFLTSNNLLYRWTGSAWTNAVPAVTVTGQLTNDQLASIAAAKLTGEITETQIADDAITTPKISAGAVDTAELAAGAVTAEVIAANAVTAAKIEAGTITASEIAGNTITGNKIVANTITGGLLNTAGIITTAAQIENGVIENLIANGAITTAKITNANITTLKIADEAVTIPEGASGSVSKTLTTTFQYIGGVTLDYGTAGENPSAAVAMAGIQVGTGSTSQGVTISPRRVNSGGGYTGVQNTTSIRNDFGGQVLTGAKFSVSQVSSATSVDFDVYGR